MDRARFTTAGKLAILALVVGLLMPLAGAAQERSPVAGDIVQPKTKAQIQEELKAAFAATDEPALNTDGTLVIGATGDLQSANPFLVDSDPSLTVVQLIYEGLFNVDPRTGEPVCAALCDSYEIAPDGVTYTFHLSKTARFTDGSDLTAADVDFSLQALADPATQSAYTGSFDDTVASWKVIDDDTIQIVAKEPRYTFIYDIQNVTVIPKHLWENIPRDQWATDPASTGQDPSRVVGTGPFKLESWTQGQEVRLVRNDDYYDPDAAPKLKEIVIRMFPDTDAQFNAFLDGQIDYIERLEPEQVDTVQAAEGLRAEAYDERGFTYYEFNLNSEETTLFVDQKVRQAFMWAIDRESIVNDIRLGYGEVAQGSQPPMSPGYAPEQMTTTYTYDPEKAKALLAEAGWTDTNGDGVVDKDGQEMSFELLYDVTLSSMQSLVAYLQDAWKQVGIEVKPRGLELQALITATTSPGWHMALYGVGMDATFVQDPLFGCNQYRTGLNDMKYCNPALDAIFAQTKREFDPEMRRELLIQASNIVNEDQPIGIIFFEKNVDAWNTRVHNVHPGPWAEVPYSQTFVGLWTDA